MKCLLDTHTFIWMATLPDKLSLKAQGILLNRDKALFLSVTSIWEMSIKASLGKLVLNRPLEQIINEQIQINGIQLLNIESAHTLAVASLPWYHKDPFDRLLISQSKIEGMPILGCDTAMDSYEIERLW